MASFLSYPGSSGYGVRPDGSYGPMYTPAPQAAASTVGDYPVFDVSTGKLKSVRTGKPWTGALPAGWIDPYAGGGSTGPGVKVPFSNETINPNDPAQRYKPVDILKSPDVAAAQQDLMKTFRDTASTSLKGFSDYLNSFQSDLANARKATAAATDIGPTVTALTGAAGKYGSDLAASNEAYRKALADSAARQRGVIGQEQAALPLYNTALDNIKAAQLAALQHQVGRYKLGTGTPTSLGTDEMRILARGAAEAALPIEMAKINKQYDIYGQALPVEAGIGGANISYAGTFLPTIAGAEYGAGTNLATTIQGLKNQVANMSTSQAIAFMQAQGIPPQIMQQVLSGQITELGGLSALEDQSRYRGLQDVLGTYLSQPVGYNAAMPGLPTYAPGTYRPGTGNTLASGGPITVTPGAPGGGIPYHPITGAPGGTPWTPPVATAPGFNYNQWLADQMIAGALGQ